MHIKFIITLYSSIYFNAFMSQPMVSQLPKRVCTLKNILPVAVALSRILICQFWEENLEVVMLMEANLQEQLLKQFSQLQQLTMRHHY